MQLFAKRQALSDKPSGERNKEQGSHIATIWEWVGQRKDEFSKLSVLLSVLLILLKEGLGGFDEERDAG